MIITRANYLETDNLVVDRWAIKAVNCSNRMTMGMDALVRVLVDSEWVIIGKYDSNDEAASVYREIKEWWTIGRNGGKRE